MYDHAFVTYDSEPDYVASAYHIIQYGIPLSSAHPATISLYISSLPVLIGSFFNMPLDIIIVMMRITLMSVLAVLLMLGINLIGVKSDVAKITAYSIVWGLIVIFPPTSILFRHLSSEIILFGLSFLLCALWYRHFELESKVNIILLGVIIGAGMNAKNTFIFVLVVMWCLHILHYTYNAKLKKGIYDSLVILLIGAFSFFVFSLPHINRVIPILSNRVDAYLEFIAKLSDMLPWSYYILLVSMFLLICWLFIFAVHKQWLSNERTDVVNVSVRNGWIVVFLVAAFVVYKLLSEHVYLVGLGEWERLGIIRRNSVPLYAFLVFFVIKFMSNKINLISNTRGVSITTLMMLLTIFVTNATAPKGIMLDGHARYFDSVVNSIQKDTEGVILYTNHDNYFDSVAQFYMWTQIRYGNCARGVFNDDFVSTYGDAYIDAISYITPDQVSKCPSTNIDLYSSQQSFYERWLSIPKNVKYLSVCTELNDNQGKRKIFLFDRRYVDRDNPSEITDDLNVVLLSCGYSMVVNEYSTDHIMSFDIIKSLSD